VEQADVRVGATDSLFKRKHNHTNEAPKSVKPNSAQQYVCVTQSSMKLRCLSLACTEMGVVVA
jgi:hypothetical protein